MSALAAAADDYLRMRRALGFKLESQGRSCWRVRRVPRAAPARRRSRSSLRSAGRPCRPARPAVLVPTGWSVVRQFARYLQTLDPALRGAAERTACPTAASGRPRSSITPRRSRALMRAARTAAPPAAGRDLRDADRAAGRDRACGSARRSASTATTSTVRAGVLTVRRRQVRQVPRGRRCTPATSPRSTATRELRDRPVPQPRCDGVLRLDARHPAALPAASSTMFTRLVARRPEAALAGCRPRLHDLRHSFAVTTLLDWYARRRRRRRPGCRCCRPTWATSTRPAPTGTCTAAPELLALAAERLEPHRGAARMTSARPDACRRSSPTG